MEKEKNSKLKEICKFEYSEEKYLLIEPSAAAVRESRYQHNRKLTDYLKEKILTQSGMQKILEGENPEFFTEYNSQRNDVLKELQDTEEELEKAEDPDRIETLSQILTIYRAHLVEQEQVMRTLLQGTAEGMADDERNSYLAFAMVRTEKGEQLAESYEDFMEENSFGFFDMCKYQLLCWEHGLNPNWSEELPEAKAVIKAQKLRELAQEKATELAEQTSKEKTDKKKPAKKKVAKKKTAKKPTKKTAKKTTKKGTSRKKKVSAKE